MASIIHLHGWLINVHLTWMNVIHQSRQNKKYIKKFGWNIFKYFPHNFVYGHKCNRWMENLVKRWIDHDKWKMYKWLRNKRWMMNIHNEHSLVENSHGKLWYQMINYGKLKRWNFIECLRMLANDIAKLDVIHINAFDSSLLPKLDFMFSFINPLIVFVWFVQNHYPIRQHSHNFVIIIHRFAFQNNINSFWKIANFLYPVLKCNNKCEGCLKLFYFHIMFKAKFGLMDLWMITYLATS